MRRNAGLIAEKLVEMRSRKPCLARDRIEFDLRSDSLRQQLNRLAHAKVGDCGAGMPLRRGVRLAPALLVAGLDQGAQLPIEAVERGRAANHGSRRPDISVERRGAPEFRAPETQATDACEPIRVDVEHEEERPVCQILRQEIVWLPGIDRNDGIFAKQVGLLEYFDAAWCAADVEDQMPFAMRVHVEGTIELIDCRAAKMTVKDGKSPFEGRSNVGSWRVDGRPRGRRPSGLFQYFLHSGTVRLGRPIFANTAG